jgi:hypothetical protein
MSDYSLDDELTRKTGEAALWLDGEIKRGAVTGPQAITALTVFDLVTLGLVDHKFNDWSRESRDDVRSGFPDKVVMHRFEKSGAETVIAVELDRVRGQVVVTQLTRNPEFTSKVHAFEDETDPVKAACAGYVDIIQRLKSKGCIVVA